MANAACFCEGMMSRLIEYLETLTVSQGRRAGEALTVLPWQSRFVAGAFEPGRTTAALSVARGAGDPCRTFARRGQSTLWGVFCVKQGLNVAA